MLTYAHDVYTNYYHLHAIFIAFIATAKQILTCSRQTCPTCTQITESKEIQVSVQLKIQYYGAQLPLLTT